MARNGSTAWAGLIVFAGSMMLVISMFNIIEGIVALVDDERIVVTPNRFIVVDLTTWGWTLLVFGLVLLAVGVGLLLAQTWARILGIIVLGLHAAWQIASLGAYPIWSLLMIALDTVVIFALTARWSDAREDLAPMESMEPGYERPAQTRRPVPDVPDPVRGYGSTPVA